MRSREARSAELSRSISVARITGRGGTGAEPGGEKRALSFRGVYLWHGLLAGEGLVRSREARSAELSRSISVARTPGRRGTGAEPGGEKR